MNYTTCAYSSNTTVVKAENNPFSTFADDLTAAIAQSYAINQSYVKAIALDTTSIPENNVQLHYNVGRAFEYGNYGIGVNYNYAHEWYKKAALKGHPHSQRAIGFLYFNGKGVIKDLKVAKKWFIKAADQGNKLAQYQLGVIYEIGLGINKNKKKAVEWYEKSAEQGHLPAKTKLLQLGVKNETRSPARTTPTPTPAPTSASTSTSTTTIIRTITSERETEYKAKIQDLENSNRELVANVDVLMRANKILKIESETLLDKIDKLKVKNKALEREADDIFDDKEALKKELRKSEDRRKSLEDEIMSLKKKLKSKDVKSDDKMLKRRGETDDRHYDKKIKYTIF